MSLRGDEDTGSLIVVEGSSDHVSSVALFICTTGSRSAFAFRFLRMCRLLQDLNQEKLGESASERKGEDKSKSRYCGAETEFNDDMPNVLDFNLYSGGFNFVIAPLMDTSHWPRKVSSWIDFDSEDETPRTDSEITLKQEIAWASYPFTGLPAPCS
ncbi:hypothetical protein VNO77_22828 [Canavalia gladiata]|uniref:PRMT5 TIM barrel domain-containing protein n=1 Tax=Canavalia gladiata TaxID=3824 RepID=A0AAN9L490_CANGL